MKTKEEVLEAMKNHLSVASQNAGKDYPPEILKGWIQQGKEITAAVEQLNSCDILWLSEQYGKWMETQKPAMIERLKTQLGI